MHVASRAQQLLGDLRTGLTATDDQDAAVRELRRPAVVIRMELPDMGCELLRELQGIQLAEGAGVYPLQIVIPIVGIALAAGLSFVVRRTRLGIAMLAVVQNPDAARLMGIDVRRSVAASYAASAVLARNAGLLIAPLFNVSSEMGTMFGLKAFAAAIIGGLGSAAGVMLAGVCLGLIEVFTTTYFGSVYTQLLTFAAVILILVVLPNGLLGRAGVKKV